MDRKRKIFSSSKNILDNDLSIYFSECKRIFFHKYEPILDIGVFYF